MTHPTVLRIGAENCPKAIDFYEADTPYDRSIFEAGIAAHAVLQACGEATNQARRVVPFGHCKHVSDGIAEHLISTGRSFDSKPEPPLNADRVWAGVELALDYLFSNPLPVGAHYETGLAVDANWKACAYKDGWLQHIADYVHLTEEVVEESATVTLVSRDYKSAWPTDESALDTLQSKVRALLTVVHLGEDADVLSLEVVNLRTLATYKRRYWLRDEETQKTFATWRRQIEATVAAYSKEPRIAAPGVGCYSCPYVTQCEAARDYIGETTIADARTIADASEVTARSYCISEGLRTATRAPVAELTKGGEPIEVDGGIVGYHYREQRALTDDAAGQIADDWEGGGGDMRGFSRACGLSVGNVEEFAKVFMAAEDTRARKKYVDALCETVRVKRFGITKKAGTDAIEV